MDSNPLDDVLDDDPLDPLIEEIPTTKWPKVIGVISLIYAILGLLCVSGTVAWTLLGEKLAAMGGMELTIPASVRYPPVVLGSVVFVLGIMMISGASGLLRRRRYGVSRLRTWAMLRIGMLVVGLVVTLFTMPGQLEIQRQTLEFQNKQWRENGRSDLVKEYDEDSAWRQVVIFTGVFTALAAAYPLFIGFYMSRPKITEEASRWE